MPPEAASSPAVSTPAPESSVRVPFLYPIVFPATRVFVRALFSVLGGWRVEGQEHVPKTGGVLIAANHLSYADPPAIGLAMRRRCWFMGKAPLFRVPVLAPVSRMYLAFPVRVDGGMDRDALRRTETLLAAGEAVCIYPEGHVSRDGKLHPLQPGAALLALRAGVPVVPAAITGTDRSIPPPHCIPHFAPGGTRVRFGPPLHPSDAPSGLSRREQADWLTARMAEALAALLPPERLPG